MPVGTRVRDKGVYEHQSLDPRFCVEIPWCSGSTMPVTFYSTVINLGSGSVPQETSWTLTPPLTASNSGSTTVIALMAPSGSVLAGPTGSDGVAQFMSFASLQQIVATTPVDTNDVYFGTLTTASFKATYNQTNLAVTYSDNPLREGASFSGSNVARLGAYTRKIGSVALPVMGVQVAASGSPCYPAAGFFTGSARTQDYLELTSYMGANNNDSTILYGLIYGNASGSYIDVNNIAVLQVVRFSESNWGVIGAIKESGSTIAARTVSGSTQPVTHIGIERNGSVFTLFSGNDVSKKVVLQTSSSIAPIAWALTAQTTGTPCPVWYLYSLTRNTSATAN